jgi:hypothetical protein
MFFRFEEGVKMGRCVVAVIIMLCYLLPMNVRAESPQDASCVEAVADIADAGIPYAAWQVSTLTGCVQSREIGSQSWFVPDGGDDDRLAHPFTLTPTLQARKADLVEQISLMWNLFDGSPYPGGGISTYGEAVRKFDDGVSCSFENGSSFGVGGPWTNTFIHDEYPQLITWAISQPGMQELGNYVNQWHFTRLAVMPQDVYLVATGQRPGNVMVMQGYLYSMAFDRFPWPWELADNYSLDLYLIRSQGEP